MKLIDNATCNVEKKNFNKTLEKCEKGSGSYESDRERLREDCATLKDEYTKCDTRYSLLIENKGNADEKEQQIYNKLEECEKDKQYCMTHKKKCKEDKKKCEEEMAKKGWFS